MLKKNLFRILFVSWLVFVTFASLFSFELEEEDSLIDIPNFDKVVHFTFYFVMVISGIWAIREYAKKPVKLSKVMIYMVLFAVVYGIIIEVVQHTATENREGDIFDALANTLGALVGMYVVRTLFSGKWSLKWKH
ncbi:MAG: VanZ family protein [Maribacter sp.]